MKVKICGLTNLDDALFAAKAGADYLGFIFYAPSKRSITPEAVIPIIKQLHSLEKCPVLVGVFVNETAVHMAKILDNCNLDLAQLSGEEVPSIIGDKKSPLYGRAYKALRPASYVEAEVDAEWFRSPQNLRPSLLIDTYHPTLRGGTGQTGDWALSAKLAEKLPGLMLAGGLSPENVTEAVQQVRPYAVDVASGVEAKPGIKDHKLVQAFIQNAKSITRTEKN
ncbi:MAG: phosphoribosylanthranilate isomerase [Anaerolineales bacterium]|nr:phosphoribosylanthranilate isomerase [Anaerolineales bacterium]